MSMLVVMNNVHCTCTCTTCSCQSLIYMLASHQVCLCGLFQAELQLAERKSSQPSAQLIQLQREMERLKVSGAYVATAITTRYLL